MTYTSPTDHALIGSGADDVIRGLVVGTRDALWQATVSAIHQDSVSNGIYALDLTSITGGNDPTDCLPGMTLDIGTTPGAQDVGSVRIRFYGGDADTVTIAETAPADLPIQVGHYVTARLEYLPWAIPKRIVLSYDGSGNINGVTEYLDYDLGYPGGSHPYSPKGNITAGHNADGTPKNVALFGWEDSPGCGYRTIHLSALDSVMHNPGATLGTILWYTEGMVIVTGSVTTPEIDLQVPFGFRHVHLFVQDSFGRQDLLFRHMPLWCDSHLDTRYVLRNFNVTSDETEGDRAMQFEFFGDAGEADATVIPKRSLVGYFEEPSWANGDTPPEGYRTQVMGWVTDDDPLLKLDESKYGIRIGSTQHYKQSFHANSVTFTDTGSAPTTYTEVQNFTVDRALDFSLIATDTLRSLVNVYYSGYAAIIEALTLPLGDAWTHLTETAPRGAMAAVGCDSLGNIWFRRQYSYLLTQIRTIVPEAISLTNADWMDADGLDLPTTNIKRIGAVNAAAELWNGGSRVLYASQAPGLRTGYGTTVAKLPDQYLQTPTPQGDLNRLSGLDYWHENNPRPTVTLVLFGNLDVIEPCWQQPILITWSDPTIRDEMLSSAPFMVKHVSIQHTNAPDETTPPKKITLTLEAVTDGEVGETAPVLQMSGVTQIADTSCGVTAGFTDVVTTCLVTFTNTSTGDLIWGYLWDFGDGSPLSSEINPTHGYATPGTYTVTLYVASDCGAYDSISHDVTVSAESVIARFDATGDGTGAVTFTDGSSADSGVIAWAWAFGDGSTSTVQNPTHTYEVYGVYAVALTVTSACGDTNSTTQNVDSNAGIIPIAAYDFIDLTDLTNSFAPAGCGHQIGSFSMTGGEGGGPSLHVGDAVTDVRCRGFGVIATPPSGDTWTSVTEVRFHFKWDNYGGFGGLWFGLDINGSNDFDSGAVLGYDNAGWVTLICPCSFVGTVTSAKVWAYRDSGASNFPAEMWMDRILVYGTVTH